MNDWYYFPSERKPSWCRLGLHRWRFTAEGAFGARGYRCERCGDRRHEKGAQAPSHPSRIDPLPGDPDEAY